MMLKILYLTGWYPNPPDNGSKIRIYNLLKAVSQNHHVDLISFYDPTEKTMMDKIESVNSVTMIPVIMFQPKNPQSIPGYFDWKPRSVWATYSPEMDKAVISAIKSQPYDMVIASQVIMAYYAAGIKLPKIFEEMELSVGRDMWKNAPDKLTQLRKALTWKKSSKYARWLSQKFDLVTVVSEKEKQLCQRVCQDARFVVIPNGTEIHQNSFLEKTPEPLIVYNGALTYSANLDAMLYFLSEIWPKVKNIIPGVKLWITGRYDDHIKKALPVDANVNLTGYVDDITGIVSKAWLVVVPLRIGGGTRLKILEAMACKTAVVSTSKGAEGLDITSGENILIADSANDFARGVNELLTDHRLREQISTNAYSLVVNKYDWNKIGDQFNALVEEVGCLRNN